MNNNVLTLKCNDISMKGNEMATLQVKIDQESKDEATRILKGLGVTMTGAINMFVQKVINTQSIPFKVGYDIRYSAETEAAMMDALEGKNLVGPFDTAAEALKSILGERYEESL